MNHLTSVSWEGKAYYWDVDRLIEHARSYPHIRVDLEEFNLNVNVWFRPGHEASVLAVARHARAIVAADLDRPLVLARDPYGTEGVWRHGYVLDGFHRLAKAHVTHVFDLPAVVFDGLPIALALSETDVDRYVRRD